MHPRVHVITLGVSDLVRSRKFYEEGLGFQASSTSNEHFVVFHANGPLIALFQEEALAEDAHVPFTKAAFRGITLAHNVAKKEDVAPLLKKVEAAGATITKVAQDTFWGGHSGYFADPDGHLWEIAWNPHWPINPDGSLALAP